MGMVGVLNLLLGRSRIFREILKFFTLNFIFYFVVFIFTHIILKLKTDSGFTLVSSEPLTSSINIK